MRFLNFSEIVARSRTVKIDLELSIILVLDE